MANSQTDEEHTASNNAPAIAYDDSLGFTRTVQGLPRKVTDSGWNSSMILATKRNSEQQTGHTSKPVQ